MTQGLAHRALLHGRPPLHDETTLLHKIEDTLRGGQRLEMRFANQFHVGDQLVSN